MAVQRQGRYETFLVARSPEIESPRLSPFSTIPGQSNQVLLHAPSDGFDYFLQSQRRAGEILPHLGELLRSWRPSVVHFHHTLHLGLELLPFVRNTLPGASIVYTLHEYIAICAADGQMLRVADRAACEYASPERCHRCFADRSPEDFKRRELFIKAHFSNVDCFIAPSDYLRERYEQWGLPKGKIEVLDNARPFQEPAGERSAGRSERRTSFGFFGSLHPNKGSRCG